MGQSRSIVDQNIETYTDLLNMCVIIERSPSSKVSADAEGMYILPKNTNCVNITDLIFSLVKVPILLYYLYCTYFQLKQTQNCLIEIF